MSTENQNGKENQSKEIKKAQEAFLLDIGFLGVILGSENKWSVEAKADSTTLDEAIKELAADEKKDLIEKIKAEAKAIAADKRKFDNAVKEKTLLFKKEIAGEQKKFTERVKGLRKLVADVKGIERQYRDTLTKASAGTDIPDLDEKVDEEEGKEEQQ